MCTSQTFTHVAALVLVFSTLALCGPTGDVSAAPGGVKGPPIPMIAVDIAADNSFTLPPTVTGGLVTFKVSTAVSGFHSIQGFRVLPGHSVEEVIQDLELMLSGIPEQVGLGVQGLLDHAEMIGGVTPTPFGAISITIPLEPGLYYFLDIADIGVRSPIVHTLGVVGQKRQQSLPPLDATLAAEVEDDQSIFSGVPSTLPSDATFSFSNDTEDEIHEAVLRPTRTDFTVTDEYINAWYDFQADLRAGLPGVPPPNGTPWAGVQSGLSMLSPGRWAVVQINLPPGRYAFIDFVPSAVEPFFLPHGWNGMHVVVTLD